MLTNIDAQNLSLHVLSAQGGSDKNDHIFLDWSIGESITTTAFGEYNILTQGFQQSFKENAIIGDSYKVNSVEISGLYVSPNPASSFFASWFFLA